MAFSAGGAGNKAFSPFTVTTQNPAGAQPQAPPGTTSFTFGASAAPGGAPPAFNFGAAAPTLSLAAPIASAPQLSFTAATPTPKPVATGFSLGGTPGSQAPSAPPGGTSFSFGASTAPGGAPPAFNFGAATPASGGTAAVATRLSFAATPTATTSTIETPSAPPVAQLSTAVTTSTVETPSITPAVQLTTPATQVTTSTIETPSAPPATQLTTATTTTQAVPTNVSQMNFRQLQEAINKWMLDLQDQEKIFLEQATKVNAWDRTLIVNGDKIGKLNESITKVKNDHTRLEHALDYLKTQQQEFEAFLEPLEAGLPVNIPVEPEREQLYSLTESVDTQLQQMAEDLKEVIRHINESNKTVDKNDPISQILRILNEHTDALQWVEDNANQVRRSLEDVSKQHQMSKKEHERSLRQMFK